MRNEFYYWQRSFKERIKFMCNNLSHKEKQYSFDCFQIYGATNCYVPARSMVVCIGGIFNYLCSIHPLEYDYSNNKWIIRREVEMPRFEFCALVSKDGTYIYIFGGWHPLTTNTCKSEPARFLHILDVRNRSHWKLLKTDVIIPFESSGEHHSQYAFLTGRGNINYHLFQVHKWLNQFTEVRGELEKISESIADFLCDEYVNVVHGNCKIKFNTWAIVKDYMFGVDQHHPSRKQKSKQFCKVSLKNKF